MFKKLFRRKNKIESQEEQLVPVPMPALVSLLISKQNEKEQLLTEAEVLDIRDNMVCIVLSVPRIKELEQSRGYADLNPENVWDEWQEFSEWYYSNDS